MALHTNSPLQQLAISDFASRFHVVYAVFGLPNSSI